MKITDIKARQYINHMTILAQLAGCTEYEAMLIYRKLRRIELKENRRMCQECNTGGNDEKADDRTRKTIARLLPNLQGFFINGDCRGYTLKVKEATRNELYPDMYQDWGGYGILAPEF